MSTAVDGSSMRWVFDPPPPSAARTGGAATWHVFPASVETFVREVLQNANDQKHEDEPKVAVRFRFEVLSGALLDSFLDAAGWATLEPHLRGAAAGGFVTISPRIRERLDGLESGGELVVLAIEDLGTVGLRGGEDDARDNFAALCRHELVTSETNQQRGGSFGLGKSVLWRFSSVSTVLFSSTVQADAGRQPRFFGRALLPFHETGAGDGREGWAGSGWLGRPEMHGYGERAASVWNEEAEARAVGCLIPRTDTKPGTSLLVVGFAEPNLEEPRELPSVCADIAAAAARWFWPAMAAGRLEVQVEAHREGEELYNQRAEPTADVRPFIMADGHDGPLPEIASEGGQVAERRLELRVPARRTESGAPPVPAVDGRTRLRMRLAQTEEQTLAFHVALRRGTGMVVRYLPIPRGVSDEAPFHAVLTAGTARGDEPEDRAIEEFLRAAEPPEHREWTAKTDRMAASYLAGAGTTLDRLWNDIRDAVRGMTEHAETTGEELPERLRRLFPIAPEGGGPPPPPATRLEDVEARLVAGDWRFNGRYRIQDAPRDWSFRVRLILDEETGHGERATVTELQADSGEPAGPRADGSWIVTVPAGTTEVSFSGIAPADTLLPAGAVGRTRIRLSAQQV